MKAFISILSIVVMTSSFSAETKKRKYELTVKPEGVEYECHQEKCIEALPPVTFSEASDRKYDLAFNAEFVTMENEALIFTNPRINDDLIDPNTSVCMRYKKNIFGYDVCQELKSLDIRSYLCRMLGLGNADTSIPQGLLSYNSASKPFLYKYSKEQDYWSRLRLGSLLLPSTNFTAIAKLKCHLN